MALTKESLAAEQGEYEAAHQELDAAEQHAGLGDMVRNLGKKILGDGTKNDATGAGRDYLIHVKESEAAGEKPMTREEFIKSRSGGNPVKA